MLKIRRTTPPAQFFEVVAEPRERLLHWAHRDAGERRQRRAPIEHELFHQRPIVELLFKEFSGACAFCERHLYAPEGISHFRPLSVFDENDRDNNADHYSWLAYEWRNLFLVCQRCEKRRQDRFPLKGSRAQFLSTFDEVRAQENPLLIDPTSDNPSSHLIFLNTGECFPNRRSAKGKATVNLFALNDEELVSERVLVIEDVITSWAAAVEGQTGLSDDVFAKPYKGAWQDVLARTISDSGVVIRNVSNHTLIQRLQQLLDSSGRADRERMVEAINLMRDTDRLKRAELMRDRTEPDNQVLVVPGMDLAQRTIPLRNEIAHVHIANFKAIDNLSIGFDHPPMRGYGSPCMLLLGENAVGKSTFLSAIALALLGTKEAKKLRLNYRDLAHSTSSEEWSMWGRDPFEVRLTLDDQSETVEFRYDPVHEKVSGTEEQSAVVLGYGPHRYFAPTRGRTGTNAAYGVRSLFNARHALPDPSEWLKNLHGRAFEEVARTIRTILPVGDEDSLINDPRSGICVLAQGQLTPVNQLSEGYRSVFAMVADICRNLLEHWSNLETASAVVLIDEIETHLHPRWKMQVISSLRRAFPRVQFIATTHDPLCLRGMDDGEVFVLARDPAGGIITLEDLPSISGMRAEQLLTSEYFGLSSTIDPDVHLEIAQLAKGVTIDPDRAIGKEAEQLVDRLTVGDSATAQIIQEALLRYLREREQPKNGLTEHARTAAVDAVFQALRKSRAG
jgi:uncharacterized protein (TIGR02646 family)